ncbi:MAG: alpha/beta fold hydrolase, partial [Wenzhouxiangellaceae bacterium]
MLKKAIFLVAAMVTTVVATVGLLSLLAFWSHLNPPDMVSPLSPGDFDLAYENIQLQTEDGLSLAGWFIPQAGQQRNLEAATIIVLHGWPEDKGSVLRSALPLLQHYSLLLFDFRALGRSEGRHSTLGAREGMDVRAALDWLEAHGHDEIGVWGFSMGGAVALMSAAHDPRIKAVVTDTSFARLDIMARDVFRVPVLSQGMALGMRLWSRLLLGVDIRQVAPVDAIADLQTPALIIHLQHDHFVPFHHARMLQEALQDHPSAEFWFRETGVYGQVPPDYLLRLRAFFDRHLLTRQ